jgi:predicted CXXCH cytochrome family protein
VRTKTPTEWNVGCERCHGPGAEHVERPSPANIVNPTRLSPNAGNDVCISCHSQGRPRQNPMEGRYYDWPVGYRPGLALQDFWQLEEHKRGETTFTHYADGTAHKNRMQGNDFVQSVMYTHGVRCSSCHDVHGTDNPAQLLKPSSLMFLECHGPQSPNGPRTATVEEHTHHKPGSPGGDCLACHMPKLAITLGDVSVRSHTFRFVTPSMTDVYKIPNPCTSCHKDKSAAWATGALKRWIEVSPWRVE